MFNPWTGLTGTGSETVGRRIDPSHPWPFYWGTDAHGRYLLIVESAMLVKVPSDLREFGGVLVTAYSRPDGGTNSLVVALKERKDWEMFAALCRDLVEVTRAETAEQGAMVALLARLKRWQRLLQRSRDPLSEAEIMGLVAELTFLKDFLAPWYGIGPATVAWRGPLASPQDFCVERTAVEVKAKLGTDREIIEISSLEQLVTSLDRLLLFIVTLASARAGVPGAVHLGQLVGNVRDLLQREAPEVVSDFDRKLEEVRYVDGYDYSDYTYLVQGGQYFHVTEDFPRLRRPDVSPAILAAKYTLDLGKCLKHRTNTPWGNANGPG